MKGLSDPQNLTEAVFRFFARYYDAEEVIHNRISWNWEDISNSGPKAMPKIIKIELLMKRCIGSAKPHRAVFRFFARYYDAEEVIHSGPKAHFLKYDAEEVIHKRISWEEKISQTLAPKLCQKLWKIELLMKRSIGSAKPHRSVFRLFARYYDAEEVIHKRISWNSEISQTLAPKLCQKL